MIFASRQVVRPVAAFPKSKSFHFGPTITEWSKSEKSNIYSRNSSKLANICINQTHFINLIYTNEPIRCTAQILLHQIHQIGAHHLIGIDKDDLPHIERKQYIEKEYFVSKMVHQLVTTNKSYHLPPHDSVLFRLLM